MICEHIAPLPEHVQNHASTIVELQDGSILSAWFAGSREGAADVGIWGARRDISGWSKVFLLAKINAKPHWNPVLHRDGHEVVLFFKVGDNCRLWRTYLMRSHDDGRTWTEPQALVPRNIGGRGPVKNKCIVLSDGSWLAPASSEIGRWQAFVDRSDDKGLTWERSRLIKQTRCAVGKDKNGNDIKFGVIQPTLWESSPGHVHMLLRSTCGKICRSDSADGGRSWCTVYKTSMPNNNSGIDLAKMKDGSLLLAYNPTDTNWGARSPLSLALSNDSGLTWKHVCDLASENGKEFSYPAVICLADGRAAVSYTFKRECIAFSILSADEI